MNTEEKAKAYDEAIQRAKEILEIGVKDSRDKRVILSFFPELKESEDENIRKAIINEISLKERETVVEEQKDVYKSWISWLEKQRPEWSDDDKKKLNRIYRLIGEAASEHSFATTRRLIGDKESIELQDFLRSIANISLEENS